MAFETINPDKIKVGDPLTKEIIDNVKNSLDYLNTKVNELLTTSVSISILNGDISFYGYDPLDPVVFYYKVRQNISISDFRVQLVGKQGINSGFLSFDLQKSSTTTDASFSSVLSGGLSINFLGADNDEEAVATINGSENDLIVGDVLRLKVISIPSGFTGKVIVSIGA